MVPEPMVRNIARSRQFWNDLCAFEVVYQREEEAFFFLDREGAQLMLEEIQGADGWITGSRSAFRAWRELRDQREDDRRLAQAFTGRRLAALRGTAGVLVSKRANRDWGATVFSAGPRWLSVALFRLVWKPPTLMLQCPAQTHTVRSDKQHQQNRGAHNQPPHHALGDPRTLPATGSAGESACPSEPCPKSGQGNSKYPTWSPCPFRS